MHELRFARDKAVSYMARGDSPQDARRRRNRRSYQSGVRPLEDRVTLTASSPAGDLLADSVADDLLAAAASIADATSAVATSDASSSTTAATSSADWYSSVSAAWFTSLSTSQLSGGSSAVQSVGDGASTGATSTAAPTSTASDYSEWIVRLSASALDSIRSVAEAAAWLGSSPLGLSVVAGLGLPGQLLVRAAGPAAEVEQYFSSDDAFTYYVANRLVSVQATPNDPAFSSLYGLHNTGQTGGTVDADIDAPEAWNVSTGSRSIVVGVIDTGIDWNHVDLAANIWTNPGEIAGNGIDDDGNGFVDDVHGYDFVNEDGNPMDDHYHGTHVAGTIGATGDNGTGPVGVNWAVSLMGLKFLDSGGSGTTANAVRAVNYATMMKTQYGVNVRVTNNSWGGGDPDTALVDAINAGGAADILFVAAAGNDGANIDLTPQYPASFTSQYIVSVAATDHNDALAWFSNYGATGVDLAAPGVNTYSTAPNGTYRSLSGTSMATPHVAGAAALALAVNPALTALQLKNAILNNVDAVSGLAGKVATGGRLNAAKLVNSLGLSVVGTTPAAGSTVTVPPTSFTIHFSQAYTPASVDAADFTVNGVAADSFTLDDTDSITFQFNTSPVTSEGQQTIALAAGSITRQSDGAALAAFTGNFRYDGLLLGLVSSTPGQGSITSLPLTALDLVFNEALDPSSIAASDLSVSQGAVTGATLLNPTTIRFTLSGLTAEGPFSYSIAAGALRDAFGNAGGAANGGFTLDIGTVPLPAAAAVGAVGSLVYRSTFTGSVGASGDDDRLTIALDAPGRLTVQLDAAAGLTAVIEVRGPGDVLLATGAASGAGLDAVVQNVAVAAPGNYTIVVRGDASSTGTYTVNALLNTAVEAENHHGAANGSAGAAQSLDDALVSLGGTAARAAVSGRIASVGDADWYAVMLAAGESLFAVVRAVGGGSPNVSLYDPSGPKLADGTANSDAQSRDITNFVAAAAGTYYVVVTGTAAGDYQLLVGRNLEWDRSGNFNIASAQSLTGAAGTVVGAIDGAQGLGRLYVYDNATGRIREINKNTGAVIRSFAAPVGTSVGPDFGLATANNTLLAGGSSSFPIYELNPDTGAVIRTIGGSGRAVSGLAFRNNEIFIRTDDSNVVTVLDYVTGNVLRTITLSATSESLAAGSDFLYATNGSTVHVINPATGATTSTRSLGVGTIEGLGVIGNELYVSVVGSLYVFDRTTYGLIRTFTGMGDLEAVGADSGSSGFGDYYRVTLAAGQAFQASTSTPADGAGEFLNLLDARLGLYDGAGNLVATDDNGAPDGRNALLNYLPSTGGVYYLAVTASAASGPSTRGEYVLGYSGVAAPASPFAVVAVTPADGANLTSAVSQITLTFNDGVLLSSIQADDLSVDGVAAVAVTILDGSTIRFTLPTALTGGTHVVQLAAGALLDLQQTPVAPFTSTFSLDAVAPRVIASSVSDGDALAPGSLVVTVAFNEAMRTAELDASDFTLRGNLRNTTYTASAFSFDPAGTTLSLTFDALPEDSYRLTLFSGDGRFEDAGGNDLDGEAAFPLPALGSGNGVAGGDFIVNFSTDAATAPFTPAFAAVGSPGGLVYQSTSGHSAVVGAAGDVDEITLHLDAGQTLSAVVTPTSSLRAALEIIGPDGASLAASQAASPGQTVLVNAAPVVAAGIYRLRLSGVAGSTGIASVAVTLNAALEAAAYGAPANNSIATAQNLDASFVPLAGHSARGAVLGAIGGVASGSQNYSAVDSGWYSADGAHDPVNQNYIVGLSNSGDMHNWFVFNLVTVTSQILSARLVLNNPATGYESPDPTETYVLYDVSTPIAELVAGGGGRTAIYADLAEGAVLGAKTVSAADNDTDIAIDLSAAAVALLNGARGGNFAIGGALASVSGMAFQRIFGYSSGSNTRRLELTFSAPEPDYYSFTLGAGETVSLGLKNLTSTGATVTIRDGAGNILATGGPSAGTFDAAIQNFTAASAGTYYAVVDAAGQGTYELVLARDAVVDNGTNGDLASAQSLGASHSALGYLAAGAYDYYTFVVAAATRITLSTALPGDGPGLFANSLDPELTVYDSGGAVVAFNADDGWNGRDARLTFDFAPGTYRVRVGAASGAGEYALNLRRATEAPTVTGVYVRSATWTSNFLDYLSTNDLGHSSLSDLGYRLTSASSATLPWSNLDTITLQFDRSVVVRHTDLALIGSPDAPPPPSAARFTWNEADRTATWTFDAPFSTNRYLIELNPAVAPASGDADDFGEIYGLRFNAIPADVDNSQSVAFGEIGQMRLALGQTSGTPGYDPRRDWDGSGTITFADVANARLQLGSSLSGLGAPVGSPSPGISFVGDSPATIAAMASPMVAVAPLTAPVEPAGSEYAEGAPPPLAAQATDDHGAHLAEPLLAATQSTTLASTIFVDSSTTSPPPVTPDSLDVIAPASPAVPASPPHFVLITAGDFVRSLPVIDLFRPAQSELRAAISDRPRFDRLSTDAAPDRPTASVRRVEPAERRPASVAGCEFSPATIRFAVGTGEGPAGDAWKRLRRAKSGDALESSVASRPLVEEPS